MAHIRNVVIGGATEAQIPQWLVESEVDKTTYARQIDRKNDKRNGMTVRLSKWNECRNDNTRACETELEGSHNKLQMTSTTVQSPWECVVLPTGVVTG